MSFSGNVLDPEYEDLLRPAYESAFRISNSYSELVAKKLFNDFMFSFGNEIKDYSTIPTVRYFKKLQGLRASGNNPAGMLVSFIWSIMSSYQLAPVLLQVWNAHLPVALRRLKRVNAGPIPDRSAAIFTLRAFFDIVKLDWAGFNSNDPADLPIDEMEFAERQLIRSAFYLPGAARDVCERDVDNLTSQSVGFHRLSNGGLTPRGQKLFSAIGMVVQFPDHERYCKNLADVVKEYSSDLITLRTRKP
jgi:hypothetical protein